MLKSSESLGQVTRLLVSVCVFATGAFAGFFLTALVRLTPSDWYYWVGLRVLWQLGGALWLGFEVGRLLTEGAKSYGVLLISAACCGAVGAVLCINPLLDVIRGPLVIEGSVVNERYERNRLRSIKAHVRIQSSDGSLHEFSPWGRQANIYAQLVESCGGSSAANRFVILRHLDTFLSVECQRSLNE